ncbi:MAG: redoxin domain-containing protein [Variovorax sp.]|nr:redoxin domain-containing protein [Variovorax sp.]
MIRIFHDTRETVISDAPLTDAPATDALWLDATQIHEATGWEWKPQGLCRDDTCMPVPRNGDAPMVDGDRLDLAAFWRYAGWPVVHDESGRVWVLGEGAANRADALNSLQAPDFELPDLEGRMHRLSDLRGQRVFLSTWASW